MAKVSGKGSIQALEQPERSCRRWRLRVNTGYDPATKRYTQATRTFHGTKTEARTALRDFIADVESGLKLKRARTTFGEYAKEWLELRHLSGDVALGTQRKNRTDLERIIPYLGSIALEDLDADNIQRSLLLARTNGGKRSTEYTGATMRGTYTVVSMVLEHARKAKVIPSNPCEDVPAPKNDTQEKDALPRAEMRRLLSILLDGDPEPRTVAFLLALTCGLRREEACGLRWCDYDPAARCIRVMHAYSADDLALVKPKTKASQRIIPLTPEVAARLNEWRTIQAVGFLRHGLGQKPTTPIVSTDDGGHMHPENMGRAWRRFRKTHGFDGYTLHQLRHTFATRLVAQGVDMVTAAHLMGHSGTAMLEQVYAHLVPENTSKAIVALGDDLFGEPEQAVIMPFSDMGKTA